MRLVDNQTAQEYSQYVFKTCLKNDSVMLQYLKENENVTASKLESFHNFFNVLKNKKALMEVGKCVIKSVMCNTKKVVIGNPVNNEGRSMVDKIFNVLRPVFKYIEPENIETKLSEDEYLALINDMVKKNKEYKSVNVYVVIGTNMLMSLVSSNLVDLLNGGKDIFEGFKKKSNAGEDISNEMIDQLYRKVITTTNDGVDTEREETVPFMVTDDKNEEANMSLSPSAIALPQNSTSQKRKRKSKCNKHTKKSKKDVLSENVSDEEMYNFEVEENIGDEEFESSEEVELERLINEEESNTEEHYTPINEEFSNNNMDDFDINAIFENVGCKKSEDVVMQFEEKDDVEEEDINREDITLHKNDTITDENAEEEELSTVTDPSSTILDEGGEKNKKTASISQMLELFKSKSVGGKVTERIKRSNTTMDFE